VAGPALGGGIGFAARRLETTSDSVVSLQIVTPDGVVRTCDRDTNPDLFWACRGGGGRNFGIVTSFRFRVTPVSRASWFVATWPWDAAADAVPAWQRFAPNAPNALMSLLRFATGRPGPTLQAFGQFFGTEAALRRELGPLLAAAPDASLRAGTSTYMELVQRWAGCLGESPAACAAFEPATFAAKSDYVGRAWSNEAVRTVQTWIERRQGASGALLLDAYGGALSAVAPDATAFVHRNVLHSLQYLAYWATPGAAAGSLGWIRGFHAAMRAHVTGAAYQNYVDPDLEDWRTAYYGANYARLVQIQRRYDPDRRFAFRQGVH
jgi:FAD/FMN-containing dehydrogenase